MSKPKAVVLLSGGLDSTTVLAMALNEGFEAYAMSFRYGQRHSVELNSAEEVARRLGAACHIVLDVDLRGFGGSALTSDTEVPKDRSPFDMGHGIPVTYVPARNTIFLSFALAWAEVLGSSDIFVGVNALDYSGYPDCRPEYIEAYERMANLATKAGVEGTQKLKIHAPLSKLSKADIIKAGMALGIDYSLTSSCYDPDPEGRPCARCDACLLRAKGFAEAGMPDPLMLKLSRRGIVMGMTADEARARALRTYNAAADVYDDPANSFWERFGRRTIERLNLRKGAVVLDVCCGSGASALPAAEVVGPSGLVLGVDLADRLLDNARAKAKARALHNVEFRVGDLLDLRVGDDPFDAVVCVFGIFFVPDMAQALRLLWERVRSGGKLAITTWGPRFFEPATAAFWDAIRGERPDLYRGFNPWDRICDPQSLSALFAEAGIAHADVAAESGRHGISSPEAWWAAVLGSGYRGTLDQLDAAARDRVRAANLEYIRSSGIKAVEANVVYAVADKT